jgi:hypothetical protein
MLRPDTWTADTLVTASVVGGALVAVHLAKGLSSLHPDAVDFAIFYAAVRRWYEGEPLYALHLAINYNPPQFHLLMVPLGVLPLAAAFLAWSLVSAGAAFLTVRTAIREAAIVWTAAKTRVLVAMLLLSAGTGAAIHLGQVSWVIALFVASGWRAARHGRWNRAGLWLGLSASLKPFLLLFVPMLILRRRWTCLSLMLLSFAASIATGMVVFGREAMQEWLSLLRMPPHSDQTMFFINASVSGLLARAHVVASASTSIVVTLAAMSIASVRKASEDHWWYLGIVSSVLLSPLGWIYYLPLLMAPLLLLAAEERMPAWTWAAWPLLSVPPISKDWLQGDPRLAVTLGSVYVWGWLVLWAAGIAAVPMERRRQPNDQVSTLTGNNTDVASASTT